MKRWLLSFVPMITAIALMTGYGVPWYGALAVLVLCFIMNAIWPGFRVDYRD